jgi:hypothetical protein
MSGIYDQKPVNSFSDDEDVPDLEEVPVQDKSLNSKHIEREETGQRDYTTTEEDFAKAKTEQTDRLYEKMAKSMAQPAKQNSNSLAEKNSQKVELIKPSNTASPIIQEINSAFSQFNLPNDTDFLEKIMKSQVLQRGFANPKVMGIINEMTTNPEIFKQYANDPEFGPFFKEYMGLLSSKFQQKASKEAEDRKKPDDFLIKERKDPEIERILQDPELKAIVEKIQRERRIDFYELARSNPPLAQKVKALIDKGFFQVTH